jgi:membrane protein DedA with SNARE-associated domain
MLDIMVADLTDVRLWLIVIFVSAIGLVEKFAFYRVGQQSIEADLSNLPGFDPERRARIETLFQTKGSYILLLASIPGIGALTAAIAGAFGISAAVFVFWVAISNLTRNWLIVILSGQIVALF